MRRIHVLLGAAALAVVTLTNPGFAHAYPVAPTISLSLHSVTPGESITLTVHSFCGPTVHVDISGPAAFFSLGDIPIDPPYTFTAPVALSTYTVSVTGSVTCVSQQGMARVQASDPGRASASDSFVVVAAAIRTSLTTPNPALATTPTSALATATTVRGNDRTAIGASSTARLSTTGINSVPTLQIAGVLALGGGALVIVARTRRRQRSVAA